MPTALNSTMATFADDTAVMAVGETVENSTRKLQLAVNKVTIWTKYSNKIQQIQISTY
jgi:phage gp45-like